MIFKSYTIEKNINPLDEFLAILFYGENIGLKDDFKKSIKNFYNKNEQINFNQDELLKNPGLLEEQILNTSLFSNNKTIFINDYSEKLKKIISDSLVILGKNTKIILFADNLDKKSILRNIFEKEKKFVVIPCYKDNDKSLSIYIREKLKDYVGLTQEIINLLIKNSDTDRKILSNEIEKIKNLFIDKKLIKEKITDLINNPANIDFDNLRDSCLEANKIELNRNLSNVKLQSEKTYYYLANLNNRIEKLIILNDLLAKNKNIELTLNSAKPKIFWKDIPIFKKQIQIWNKKKLGKAIKIISKNEIIIKTKFNALSDVLIKRMFIELYELAKSTS